jgi:formate hydrogenlyase subunit 6/NADH:ubiquinone oxidoreductase subunit I
MTKTVVKNLFGGPATLMHPKKKRAFTPITRGSVEIDINECIFCGLCGRRCPTYAIAVTKSRKEWQIDCLKCCICNLCVEICPTKCLRMDKQYFPSVTERSAGLYVAVMVAEEPGAPTAEPSK